MGGLTDLGLQGLLLPPLKRRGFVMTSVITGFTLATERAMATAIHTSTEGMTAGEMDVPVADGHLPGYFAKPNGPGPFPVVLVVEEVFGVHEYIQDVCRRLAKLGYLAASVELYARLGNLSDATSFADIGKIISRAPDATVMTDIDSLSAWAFAHGGDAGRFGITGFCRGGRAVWLYAAHSARLKAAVAWYGPLDGAKTDIQPQTALDIAGDIKCPLLGLYGEKDPGIPPTLVREAEAKAKTAGKTVEIAEYPDAAHAFHADYRPSYVQDAAEDGWRRMQAWFRKYGVV